MKTLKFASDLSRQILAGTKTSTWRLFDDKDLQTGDELMFIDKETLQPFGVAKITSLKTKTLGTLVASDSEGHEQFGSEEEMYATFKKYYGEQVGPTTEVKIIHFEFKKN